MTACQQTQLLHALAQNDVGRGAAVTPTLLGQVGDTPMVAITVRPFTKGGHLLPVMEAAALTQSMGCDHLLLSLGGRAWSTADPIKPVVDELVDMRQQVLVIHEQQPGVSTARLYAVNDGTVDDEPATISNDLQGAVTNILADAVRVEDGEPDWPSCVQLARDLEQRGHGVAFSPAAASELMATVSAALGVMR